VIRTKKAAKKKSGDDEFDITPMIDVVLLLLIFFMVSARMAPGANARLPKAKHGEMTSMHDAIVLTVKNGGNDSDVLTSQIVRIQNAVGSVLEPEHKIFVAVEH